MDLFWIACRVRSSCTCVHSDLSVRYPLFYYRYLSERPDPMLHNRQNLCDRQRVKRDYITVKISLLQKSLLTSLMMLADHTKFNCTSNLEVEGYFTFSSDCLDSLNKVHTEITMYIEGYSD